MTTVERQHSFSNICPPRGNVVLLRRTMITAENTIATIHIYHSIHACGRSQAPPKKIIIYWTGRPCPCQAGQVKECLWVRRVSTLPVTPCRLRRNPTLASCLPRSAHVVNDYSSGTATFYRHQHLESLRTERCWLTTPVSPSFLTCNYSAQHQSTRDTLRTITLTMNDGLLKRSVSRQNQIKSNVFNSDHGDP